MRFRLHLIQREEEGRWRREGWSKKKKNKREEEEKKKRKEMEDISGLSKTR